MRKSPWDTWREELLQTIWDVQEDYWGWSHVELAQEADLAPATVYRLYNKQTKEPRLHTIYKLAKAVGMTVQIIEEVKQAKQRKRRAA